MKQLIKKEDLPPFLDLDCIYFYEVKKKNDGNINF